MCVAVLAEGVSNTFELGWWRPAYVNTGRVHFIMCPLVMFQERQIGVNFQLSWQSMQCERDFAGIYVCWQVSQTCKLFCVGPIEHAVVLEDRHRASDGLERCLFYRNSDLFERLSACKIVSWRCVGRNAHFLMLCGWKLLMHKYHFSSSDGVCGSEVLAKHPASQWIGPTTVGA